MLSYPLQASTRHLQKPLSVTIRSITWAGAERVVFQKTGATSNTTSVSGHFESKYGRLRHPHVPCAVVNLGVDGATRTAKGFAYFPLEALDLRYASHLRSPSHLRSLSHFRSLSRIAKDFGPLTYTLLHFISLAETLSSQISYTPVKGGSSQGSRR